MSKKVEVKSSNHSRSIADYIKSVDPKFAKDAKTLLKLFKDVTGVKPKMWGSTIVGFGEYHYKYESGREGDFLATGFSIRKSGPTVYILPGYNDYSKLLEKLGPHKLGRSCLHFKNVESIDLKIVERLIKAGLKDLRKQYTVTMK